jgi:hypothetical protein
MASVAVDTLRKLCGHGVLNHELFASVCADELLIAQRGMAVRAAWRHFCRVILIPMPESLSCSISVARARPLFLKGAIAGRALYCFWTLGALWALCLRALWAVGLRTLGALCLGTVWTIRTFCLRALRAVGLGTLWAGFWRGATADNDQPQHQQTQNDN